MEYTPPQTRNGTTFELDRAHELSDLPPLWAIPNLIPCHRLSLIVAPSGTGLTQLALNLAASAAPSLPQFLDPQSTLGTTDGPTAGPLASRRRIPILSPKPSSHRSMTKPPPPVTE
jgi:hypothetical protein